MNGNGSSRKVFKLTKSYDLRVLLEGSAVGRKVFKLTKSYDEGGVVAEHGLA